MFRVRLLLLFAILAALLVGAAAPVLAHNDNCAIAVHFAGHQVHPNCG